MEHVELIAATLADLPFVAEVCESVVPMYQEIMPGSFERQAEKFRTAQTLPEQYTLLLIVHHGERVGFIGYSAFSEEVIYLVALYIHAAHQRSGIGGKALEKLLADFWERGYGEVLLFAHQEAEWAINFYYHHGFQPVSEDLQAIKQYRNGILANSAFSQVLLMQKYSPGQKSGKSTKCLKD